MKYISSLLVLMVLLSCSPAVRTVSSGGAVNNNGAMSEAVPAGIEEDILRLINDHRRSRGLGALQTNAAASAQAEQHSKNMATGRTAFSHDGFDQRISNIKKELGVTYLAAVAENVAEGQMSAKEVVKGWLNSSGHRKNIEGNYNQSGIGVYRSRNGDLYFTQIFLRR